MSQRFNYAKELADLTMAIGVINVWNRLNISARTVPGVHRPKVLAGGHRG